MSTKHTPGPWKYDTALTDIVSANDGQPIPHTEDNIKRIVECVNAMAGIKDPQAFMEVVKQLELDYAESLKKQRDQALAHIQKLVDICLRAGAGKDSLQFQTKIDEAIEFYNQTKKTNEKATN